MFWRLCVYHSSSVHQFGWASMRLFTCAFNVRLSSRALPPASLTEPTGACWMSDNVMGMLDWQLMEEGGNNPGATGSGPNTLCAGVGNSAGTPQVLRATGSAFLSTLLSMLMERLQRGEAVSSPGCCVGLCKQWFPLVFTPRHWGIGGGSTQMPQRLALWPGLAFAELKKIISLAPGVLWGLSSPCKKREGVLLVL